MALVTMASAFGLAQWMRTLATHVTWQQKLLGVACAILGVALMESIAEQMPEPPSPEEINRGRFRPRGR
jgi:hypothetical protein